MHIVHHTCPGAVFSHGWRIICLFGFPIPNMTKQTPSCRPMGVLTFTICKHFNLIALQPAHSAVDGLLGPSRNRFKAQVGLLPKPTGRLHGPGGRFHLSNPDPRTESDVVVMPPDAAGDHQFRMGDGLLHVSEQYKYLGVEMGPTGQGCWNSYLERAQRKAMAAMHSLTFSVVDGSKPLWVSTAAHLFKTLVRPILEYGGAMYGPMCSDAALATLERVQVIFLHGVTY